jgi:type I restriction enzyme S subunit
MSIFRSPFNDYLSKVFNSALFEYQSGSFLTATINQLTTANLNSFEIPLPPKYEREKIADFLDHETAKIDTLIDKQQQLIQLLKEKRQAVISHAVTKGLNPNATMKDSGVEWLGEVPEHWDVLQIRRILDSMEQGKSPECDSHVSEAHEWGVLKTSCVNKAIYNSEANKALPSTTAPFVQYEVKKGDVLMSRASGSINLIGSVAYVDETRSQILLSDKIFRLHLNQKVNRKFFTLLMRSTYMRRNIERSISGAEGMANNITKSAIIGFSFALPPKEDQDRISSIAMQQLDVFDELIVKVETAIGLIQERRTALISAAVTGKIDVREWNASKMETNA